MGGEALFTLLFTFACGNTFLDGRTYINNLASVPPFIDWLTYLNFEHCASVRQRGEHFWTGVQQKAIAFLDQRSTTLVGGMLNG